MFGHRVDALGAGLGVPHQLEQHAVERGHPLARVHGQAVLAFSGHLVYANLLFREHLGLEHRASITVTAAAGLHDLIAAEHEAIDARTRSEQTWRATFDHAPAGIALVDTDVARGHELLARRHRGYRIPKRYVHRDGHDVTVDLWCTLVCDDAGEPVHFVTQILEQPR